MMRARSLSRSRLVAAAAIALALSVPAAPAFAGDDPSSLPVITAGREKDAMALIAPYQLGTELGNGWHVEAVAISGTFIRVTAVGPEKAAAAVRLELPQRAPSKETTPSFAVHRESGVLEGGAAAPAKIDLKVLDPIVNTIRKNDNGKFWPTEGPTVPKFVGPDGVPPKPGEGGNGNGGGGGQPGASSPQSPEQQQVALTRNSRRILVGVGVFVSLAVLFFSRKRKAA